MILAKRNNSAGITLPALDVPPEHIAIRHSTPPDLKGLKYTHLPGLGSDGRSSEVVEDDTVMLLPVLDEPHPFPYIISPSITLTGKSVGTEDTQEGSEDEIEIASHYFLLETQFSKEFLEDLLADLLQQECFDISQAELGMEDKEETTHEMEPEEQLALIKNDPVEEVAVEDVLDENSTISDDKINEEENFTDGDLESFIDEHMDSEMDIEARNIAWEYIESLLSEWELTKSSQNEMQQLNPQLRQALSLRMAGQTPIQDEAIMLDGTRIEVILFEYHHMLHHQKLEDNEALRHFQNDLIGHSLTSLILQDSLHYLDKDFDTLKNEERQLHPPRV